MTRAEAVQAALERGARIGVARGDTSVAAAQVLAARALPNPTFSATYTKSVPEYHYIVDVPVDFPWLRQLRIRAAQVGLRAAELRFQLARAMVALGADTSYTRAVAARARVALSRRNALDADSLLHMVERRRDAGDASDLDVELARINAGQQENIASRDSLTLAAALLDLQAFIGLTSGRVEIAVTDSLGMPPEAPVPSRTLAEFAAELSTESATLGARLQRRSLWTLPTVSFGFETGDPDQRGLLPTVGIAIALPLFDRNRGPIALAEAERRRAVAEATLARVEARNQIAHAGRERENALAMATRGRSLVNSANRVAAMALTAYREGASTLPNVLDAQRSAREVLAQYVTDLERAWIATAELRVLALQPRAQP